MIPCSYVVPPGRGVDDVIPEESTGRMDPDCFDRMRQAVARRDRSLDLDEAIRRWHARGLMHPLELNARVTERLVETPFAELRYEDFFYRRVRRR